MLIPASIAGVILSVERIRTRLHRVAVDVSASAHSRAGARVAGCITAGVVIDSWVAVPSCREILSVRWFVASGWESVAPRFGNASQGVPFKYDFGRVKKGRA